MKNIVSIFKMIKFSHSIFALPFAFVGMLLGAHGLPDLRSFILIVVAMVSARSLAMALNRIIDSSIDKINPRTKNREIPSGKISLSFAILFSIVMFILFEISTFMLNDLVFKLSFIVVLLFIIYPYTKRFSVLCHMILGIIDGLAPIGAYLSITPHFSYTIFVFGLSVSFWVAGFDIIYSLLDTKFDIENKLYSVSSRYGKDSALFLSKIFHIVSVSLLIAVGIINDFGFFYYLSIAVVGGLLVYEQILAAPMKKGKIYKAFFNVNSIIGIVVLIAVAYELLLVR